MAIPQLSALFRLEKQSLPKVITHRAPGAYIAGFLTPGNKLHPFFAGRANVDLVERLSTHIGNYEAFMYSYATSPAAAYVMECELFHAYKPPDNKTHPEKSAGTNWKCPICKA